MSLPSDILPVSFSTLLHRKGIIMSKKILYIDMDGVLCDFFGAIISHKKQHSSYQHPHSKLGFFENLETITGAINAVNKLRDSNIFEPWILTAPSTRNPHCYTEKRLWVEKHFDYQFTKNLIISPNKSLLKGDFLVDDYCEGKGQEYFEGELIHFGTERYANWNLVMEYLKSKVSIS